MFQAFVSNSKKYSDDDNESSQPDRVIFDEIERVNQALYRQSQILAQIADKQQEQATQQQLDRKLVLHNEEQQLLQLGDLNQQAAEQKHQLEHLQNLQEDISRQQLELEQKQERFQEEQKSIVAKTHSVARARECNLDALDPELKNLLLRWPQRDTPANVIDAFFYNGEWRILKMRLAELNDGAGQFILMEGTATFTNTIRKLRFPQVRDTEAFFKYSGKIRHHVVGDFPPLPRSWDRENWFRDQLQFALVDAKDDDLLIMSDVDEIPTANVIECIRDRELPKPFAIDTWPFCYSFSYMYDNHWNGPRIMTVGQFRKDFGNLGHNVRAYGARLPGRNGWHLSYFFPISDILDKIQSFSHTEYSGAPYNTPEYIYDQILRGKGLFGPEIYLAPHQMPAHEIPQLMEYETDPAITFLKYRIDDHDLPDEQRKLWKNPLQ